ncbi:MAG: DUF4251 domain-containing protein [Ferruginibacter sp.]
MKNLIKISVLLFIVSLTTNNCFAQHSDIDKKELINDMLNSQKFVFVPEYVSPMAGQGRVLTSPYSLEITKDTVKADMPYFGVAYTAPINPENAGIYFTSTKFNYDMSNGKQGRKEISIKTKDVHNARTIFLTVFSNGKATLNVTDQNRQPISFNGYIKEIQD